MSSFPRHVRLTRPVEFQRVFQQGRRFYEGSLTARAVPNEAGFPRLGMAIAKKALRRAHDRNRIRRLIRESFRQHQATFPATDIVIMCRSEVLNLSNKDLFQQLEGLWLRLHRLYSAGSGQTAKTAALP